jgi:hypothetical protein
MKGREIMDNAELGQVCIILIVAFYGGLALIEKINNRNHKNPMATRNKK